MSADPADAPGHLRPFLNQIVRYKEFKPENGTVTRDYDFLILETQKNYAGQPRLRGYKVARDSGRRLDYIGRVINHEDIEIVPRGAVK